MKSEILELTTTEIVDINAARSYFEASKGFSTGDNLVDSATEYFGNRYLESIRDTQRYRSGHFPRLDYLSLAETQVRADMFQAMFEKVVDARRLLEDMYPDEIEAWLCSKHKTREAYKVVLADKIANNLDFRDSFFEGDEADFTSDCYNVVQWLEGWLKFDRVG